MTTYSFDNLKTLKLLARNDKVIFPIPGGTTVTLTVRENYLEADAPGDRVNSRVLNDWGLKSIKSRVQFAEKAYGYKLVHTPNERLWPESKYGDFAALTRVAKALFARIKNKNKGKVPKVKVPKVKVPKVKHAAFEAFLAEKGACDPPKLKWIAYANEHDTTLAAVTSLYHDALKTPNEWVYGEPRHGIEWMYENLCNNAEYTHNVDDKRMHRVFAAIINRVADMDRQDGKPVKLIEAAVKAARVLVKPYANAELAAKDATITELTAQVISLTAIVQNAKRALAVAG